MGRCGTKPDFGFTSILNYHSLIKTYSLSRENIHQWCRVQGWGPAGNRSSPWGTRSRESDRHLFPPIRESWEDLKKQKKKTKKTSQQFLRRAEHAGELSRGCSPLWWSI